MPSASVIDWSQHKAIVFESDDWGNCATCPDRETLERVRRHPAVIAEGRRRGRPWGGDRLEDRPTLQALLAVLQGHRGGDGRPAVFTAFYPTCNPDYDRIRESQFREYHDIPIDRGWSPGWKGEGAMATAREGMRRGLWCPEFHARLHHSSPRLWLEILRGPHEETEVYRFLFDHHIYHFNRHLPEYDGMNIREQYEWLRPAVEAFRRAFGYGPHCAVNSDAIPGTEECYALLGLGVRCLRSVVLNDGRQIRPYGDLKPDGTMDGTNVMGTYNRFLDLVYLNRNAFFEVAGARREVLDEAYGAIVACWARGEPAVTSTHRAGYCSLDEEVERTGRQLLDELLGRVEREHPEAVYLTSWEVAQLCRRGVSAVRLGEGWVLRNYTAGPACVETSDALTGPATDLRSGRTFDPTGPGVYRLPPGDYEAGGQ